MSKHCSIHHVLPSGHYNAPAPPCVRSRNYNYSSITILHVPQVCLHYGLVDLQMDAAARLMWEYRLHLLHGSHQSTRRCSFQRCCGTPGAPQCKPFQAAHTHSRQCILLHLPCTLLHKRYTGQVHVLCIQNRPYRKLCRKRSLQCLGNTDPLYTRRNLWSTHQHQCMPRRHLPPIHLCTHRSPYGWHPCMSYRSCGTLCKGKKCHSFAR